MRQNKKRRIERLVAKRAHQLDQVEPGWSTRVTRPIDLLSASTCVLGQVYGWAYAAHPFMFDIPFRMAFLVPGFCFLRLDSLCYATECWRKEVGIRQPVLIGDFIPEGWERKGASV